jgi:hypothetical protein
MTRCIAIVTAIMVLTGVGITMAVLLSAEPVSATDQKCISEPGGFRVCINKDFTSGKIYAENIQACRDFFGKCSGSQTGFGAYGPNK